MILIDTHVLIWLDEANAQLGSMARNTIDDALLAGNFFGGGLHQFLGNCYAG